MNLRGEHQGIKWIGFDRERPGRRKERILKYSLVAGEWRQITAPKEVTSEAKFRAWVLSELQRIVETGEQPKRVVGGPTVADLADRWLEIRKADPQVSGATYRDDKSAFDSQIIPRWGAVPVASLHGKRHDLRAWVRELATKVSPSRCRNVVSTFRKFLDSCHLEGWVIMRVNPLESREVRSALPKLEKNRDVVTLSQPVVQALIECEQVELRRAVRYAVAACTGAGDGELAGARVSDVLDLDGSYPRLQVNKAFKLRTKDGKSGRGRAELGKPKNDYRRRAIPLNECARAALKQWLEDGWELWVGRQPSPTDPLFPNAQGAFSRPDFAEYLRKDLELAGQPTADPEGRPYDFRALRRTFSTLLAAADVDRETRERLMGQRSGKVNTEHYTAVVPAKLFDAVRRLPLVWNRCAPSESIGTARARSAEPNLLVADPQSAANPSREAEPPAHNGAENTPVPESPEHRNAFVNRRSRVQIPKLAPERRQAPPSGATKAPPSDDEEGEADHFRAALVEHAARAEVAGALARPIAKTGRPASDPGPERAAGRNGGRRA